MSSSIPVPSFVESHITSNSFDTTYALSSMYLWLLFGFLATLVNCDLQRAMAANAAIRHLVALLAFFFLFTVLDASNTASLATTWLKTVFVYIVFILSTKSKWYFAVPVLLLLLIDQSIKRHSNYSSASGRDPDGSLKRRIQHYSHVINTMIVVLVVVGAVHYGYLQRIEYGPAFSLRKFFVGTNKACKKTFPKY